VNDFVFGSRAYHVYVQADHAFRSNPRDIESFYVRSRSGEMISLSRLITTKNATSAQSIDHYNLFRSTTIGGSPAMGKSTSQAMATMEAVARKQLGHGMTFEWSGISKEQLESGRQTVFIFVLGLLFVFLVLAAQYESFVLPTIILLAVPTALLGALALEWARGFANDLFCQIGLVMLIGLSSKNAILVVEFARELHERGMAIKDAAIKAATTRLRPILMTSVAFLLGVLPLVFASGAGAASRQSLGTAVFGGMVLSTVLNLVFIPSLYVAIESLRARFKRPGVDEDEDADDEDDAARIAAVSAPAE
jgi:HAE1 family hydrophobic/amphiphilic exporter-1